MSCKKMFCSNGLFYSYLSMLVCNIAFLLMFCIYIPDGNWVIRLKIYLIIITQLSVQVILLHLFFLATRGVEFMKEYIDKKRWMCLMYTASLIIFLIAIAEALIYELLFYLNRNVLEKCDSDGTNNVVEYD